MTLRVFLWKGFSCFFLVLSIVTMLSFQSLWIDLKNTRNIHCLRVYVSSNLRSDLQFVALFLKKTQTHPSSVGNPALNLISLEIVRA